jgi:hypothetical protein
MKTPGLLPLGFTLLSAALFPITSGHGQTETKAAVDDPASAKEEQTGDTTPPASTLTTTGSVFSVDPDTFSVTPEKVTIPLNFMYNSKTLFVDETEKSVPWEHMRAGLPVTVDYTTLGEKMLATKVTATRRMIDGGKKEGVPGDEAARKREELADAKLRKDAETAVRVKALPATGGGTIMGFEQVIAVRPQGSSDVVQYVVNNSTQYVDTAGQPVALNLVRTGVPISIQFMEHSGRKIATQVILQRTTSPPPETKTGSNSTGRSGSPSATTASATGGGTNYVAGTVPGTLEDGFINPPITVLPGATTGTQPAGVGSGTSTNTSSAVETPAGTSGTTPGSTATRPGGAQPSTQPAQPAVKQPATKQPAAPQPATRQPAAPPAPAPAPRGR